MVNYLMGRYGVGNRQACRCVRLHRSMYYYRSRMEPLTALRQRMRELAHTRLRFAYRRIFLLLNREGWDVGEIRFYRVYCEENLGLRRKRSWRHVTAVHREVKRPAGGPNDVWGMDFVADQLADGRKLRTLTVIDLFTRECLAIEVGFSLRAEHVPPVMHLMVRYTQALITQIAQTAVCNRHHSVDQQLCRWLLLSIDRLQGGELVITQELIANMLGVRREGVTEAAGNLQHAGLIKYRRGHIAVLDRSGLEKRSCECYQVVRNEYARLLPDRTATKSVLVQRLLSPDANESFRAKDCKNLNIGEPAPGSGSPRCSGDSPTGRPRSRPIANSLPPLRRTIVQTHIGSPVLIP
jgi:hypothetical protein